MHIAQIHMYTYRNDDLKNIMQIPHPHASEDHVGVRVGMFEMRGMGEYRGQIKYLQLMGTSEVMGWETLWIKRVQSFPVCIVFHCWLRLLQPLH